MIPCFNADTLKFNAYRDVADNLAAAKVIIESRKLAYGETSVVPYYYPDITSVPKQIFTLLGVGGIDGTVTFFTNVLDNNTIISDANITFTDLDGSDKTMSVSEAIEYAISEQSQKSGLVGILTEINETLKLLANNEDVDKGSLQTITDAINKLYVAEEVIP